MEVQQHPLCSLCKEVASMYTQMLRSIASNSTADPMTLQQIPILVMQEVSTHMQKHSRVKLALLQHQVSGIMHHNNH